MSNQKSNNTFDKSKEYSTEEAVELLLDNKKAKFTESCDLDIILSPQAKKKNDAVRGSITFPNQFGEVAKILVVAKGEQEGQAKDAGADFVGNEDMIKKISDGWTDFDVLIATPDMMPEIAKLGKILGPRQLMPNPKNGTVTTNVADAIKLYKSGKVDFKLDPQKTIKVKFADVSLEKTEILENLNHALEVVLAELRRLTPDPVSKIMIHSTMGPGIKVKS